MTPFLVTWIPPPLFSTRFKQLAAINSGNIILLLEQFLKDVYFHLNLRISGAVVTISTLSRARVTLCEALVKK